MGSFSEEMFVKKLGELNNSQQSIQTLSLWLIHHRKHSKTVVDTWLKFLRKCQPSKKLTLIYLINDVIQNSKRKGPEYMRDCVNVLPEAFRDAARDADEKSVASMDRVLNIWVERTIYEHDFIDRVKKSMRAPLEQKPAKHSDAPAKPAEPAKKKKKMEISLREEIENEMLGGAGEPPTADELIKALTDLENSASSDAVVRERIAALPLNVSDASLLDKLADTAEADTLAKTVDDACSLLADYNARLADELVERKRVAKLLYAYIIAQKDALIESEVKLVEYKGRLTKVDAMHKELKAHVQSLPDLSLLPDTSAGLAPLPSAGDLFNG